MILAFNALGSASHRNMFDHVPGPLRSAAVENAVTINNTGIARIEWSAREPLILVGLKSSLEKEGLQVSTVRDPATDNETLPLVRFAHYSESGAFLPVYQPGIDAITRHAVPLQLRLRLKRIAADGSLSNVPVAEVKNHIEVVVIEGVMARVAYLLGAEQQRIRRITREIHMMRSLRTARDSALDRIGAELAVPRFSDEIDFDTVNQEIITRSLHPDSSPIIEPDNEYRRRLAIYRPLLYPSVNHLREALNGSGDAADPNGGLLSALGVVDRFTLIENDNAFSFAIHLVSTGADSIRANFLEYLRDIYLIAPRRALENTRFLSSIERARQNSLRSNLRNAFNFGLNHYMAPMLARALERVARCRRSLLGGALQKRNVLRAQSNNHGSRYELGLGVDLQPLTNAERTALANRLQNPARPPAADAEIEGLLQKMAALPPPSSAEDPDTSWFFEACGMRTVHRIAANRIYVSHLPTQGLVIEGASSIPPGGNLPLNAKYHAPGDPGANALLIQALSDASDAWNTLGENAWVQLTPAQGLNRWQNAIVNANANTVFAATDLPTLTSVAGLAGLADRLQRVPADLIVTLRLHNNLATQILNNHADASDRLLNLKRVLSESGFASMLPLATSGNQVVIVASVIGLPGVGSNLAARRSAGFRWYVVPLQGLGGTVGSIGTQTQYQSNAMDNPGLAAVVTVGYTRDPHNTDPYEFRIELPDDARLDIKQYEFLMNLLAHSHPVGVEINTWNIRQQHVDLDGDGHADAMDPTIARTYRQFRRLRHRGELGVGTEEQDD